MITRVPLLASRSTSVRIGAARDDHTYLRADLRRDSSVGQPCGLTMRSRCAGMCARGRGTEPPRRNATCRNATCRNAKCRTTGLQRHPSRASRCPETDARMSDPQPACRCVRRSLRRLRRGPAPSKNGFSMEFEIISRHPMSAQLRAIQGYELCVIGVIQK